MRSVIVSQNHYLNQILDVHPLWAGDINADFIRQTNHTDRVLELVDELNLCTAWDDFSIDFTSVHESGNTTTVSKIDHSFFSSNIKGQVEDAGVIHHVNNKSDHSPIFAVLRSLEIQQESAVKSSVKPKPSWRRACAEERDSYRQKLEERLRSVTCPVSVAMCSDVQCRDVQHREMLDIFGAEVLCSVQEAAESTLPTPKATPKDKHSKSLACWEEVREFKETANFWFKVWMSAGRPLNTELHKVMKRTRNVFHFVLRKCKKTEENMKKSKLLNACLSDGGDIFKEIKEMRRTKPVVATAIDGEKANIAEHFGNIYSTLYNSAEDEEEMRRVKEKVENAVKEESLEDVKRITPEVVKKAAEKLKSGKSDPCFTYSSDCFKNGSETLFLRLSELLQGFMTHGHVTQGLLISTLVPIVKDPLASITISKNYRSVCLASLTVKLLD